MTETLSARTARRMALAAQGFDKARPTAPGRRQVLSAIETLGLLQIDSVNVVSRSHYLPLFSRLGDYPRALLEDLAWGKSPALVEYWGHEASLMPRDLHPLFRWRMADARAGVGVWRGVASFLHSHPDVIAGALDEIRRRGPLATSELETGAKKGAGGWWGWSEAKRALECLFWIGELTTATRGAGFERIYATPEQVLPAALLDAPTPSREDAHRALLTRAARAMGVATERDLRDYFRLGLTETRARVAELVEDGVLIPARIEGWAHQAYIAQGARRPRSIKARALLSPFDNLIWFRERTERLFDARIRLEIYTPAHLRTHGYYVLPFLQGDTLTARVDLKADRKARTLLVQAAHAEPAANDETPIALAEELKLMAGWLGLTRVEVRSSGALAPALATALA